MEENIVLSPTSIKDKYTSVFLFNFFIQIYGLEIFLQIYVLLYSLFKYDAEGEPYRIIYLDIVIALLMSIEIYYNYKSIIWNEFIHNTTIQIDILIAILSFLFILLFILHKENVIYLSEEYTEIIHICRDITRGLRLQVFTRNIYKLSNVKNF